LGKIPDVDQPSSGGRNFRSHSPFVSARLALLSLQSPVLQLSFLHMGLLRTNQVKYCVPVKRLLTAKQRLDLFDAFHLQIDRCRCRVQETLGRIGGLGLPLD
tara:strand:- start:386 stop:691 length:306 start_codon:yes stop_codon:yes gene_type:complete